MEINVITSNTGKFIEMKKILEKYNIISVHNNLDTQETGNTLEERALSKAKDAYSKIKKPLIVDDTGFFFEAFDNFPGPFPKKVYQELGLDGVLKKLGDKKLKLISSPLFVISMKKNIIYLKGL